MLRLAFCLLVALLALPAHAQSYDGHYAAATGPTLFLHEDPPSVVSGTLVDRGDTYTIEGEVTMEGIFATLKSASRLVYMMAQFQAGLLLVTLAEPDAAGVPNLRDAREIAFTRQ